MTTHDTKQTITAYRRALKSGEVEFHSGDIRALLNALESEKERADAAETKKNIEWVCVKDRMPEDVDGNKLYLVTDGIDIHVTTYDKMYKFFDEPWFAVNFWAEIKELPQMKEPIHEDMGEPVHYEFNCVLHKSL